MTLNNADRITIREKYGGRCAYCGDTLHQKWCADHIIPLMRGHGKNGGNGNPGEDRIENIVPACVACNTSKATFSIDEWRDKIAESIAVLHRNHAVYRNAKRFGLIAETKTRVVFFFESKGEE